MVQRVQGREAEETRESGSVDQGESIGPGEVLGFALSAEGRT